MANYITGFILKAKHPKSRTTIHPSDYLNLVEHVKRSLGNGGRGGGKGPKPPLETMIVNKHNNDEENRYTNSVFSRYESAEFVGNQSNYPQSPLTRPFNDNLYESECIDPQLLNKNYVPKSPFGYPSPLNKGNSPQYSPNDANIEEDLSIYSKFKFNFDQRNHYYVPIFEDGVQKSPNFDFSNMSKEEIDKFYNKYKLSYSNF